MRHAAQTAADLVDSIIPRVPVRQWVLSFPLPLRSLFAVYPELLALVLQIIHRVLNTFLIKQAHVNIDRVELTGFRPSALPHHRTCGFPHTAVESGKRSLSACSRATV